jgi:hypothetical protein
MIHAVLYRSPLGRVRGYSEFGAQVITLETGRESDLEWAVSGAAGVLRFDNANWLDFPTDNPSAPSERSQRGDNMTEKTSSTKPRKTRDPNAPPITRPRSGHWTPISRQIPIPGTQDADGAALTMNADMYRVEFAGESIEVLKNRDGTKAATAWIRTIKNRSEEGAKIEKIRATLINMSETASTEDARARLLAAANILASGTVEP